jgi:hypothetical protein
MGVDVDHGLGNVRLTWVSSDPAIYTISAAVVTIAYRREIADLDSRILPV